jgi:hypothetical protein
MATTEQIARAERNARALLAKHPHAISVRYARGKVRILFSNDAEFAFPPGNAQGLEGAQASDLNDIEISPSGLGIHFPRLDADLYVPAMLENVFGSKAWTAARMGKAGGQARSQAKADAARRNGRAGGRPKKIVSEVGAGKQA